MRKEKIVLGTRGSELARAQTRLVENALRERWPELAIETRIVTTRGDEGSAKARSFSGRKGIFTGEIEEALRKCEIDVAVHSAKDLPSDRSVDLEICSALARAAVGDVLILKETGNLKTLRQNAIVATGSVRRQYQLRWKRPDLSLVDLRGNVPTRLHKLVEGNWDAVVLARAGLERLGYDLSDGTFDFDGRLLHAELLPPRDFLPAGGQGVIAIQTRAEDEMVKDCVRTISDATTLSNLHAEREFLRLLQADCNSPVGIMATMESGIMTLQAQVFEPPAAKPRTGMVRSVNKDDEPGRVAAALHSLLYGQS